MAGRCPMAPIHQSNTPSPALGRAQAGASREPATSTATEPRDVLLSYVGGGQTTIGEWTVENGTYSSYSTLGGFATNSGWAEIGTGDFTGNGTTTFC